MPISLNSFQRTLDTSKTQGFVKLSGEGTSVKSYGGGFFARHFGLYSKPSVEENNAVRRAFYESVMNAYQCEGEILATLRRDLGISDDGTSVSGRQLGVSEAKDILQRVKTAMAEEKSIVKDIDNGKPFDIPLRKAFQKAMSGFLQNSLDLADRADTIPDMKTAFKFGLVDYVRSGESLKIGDTYVAQTHDTPQDGEKKAFEQEMLNKLEHFFGQDPVNGQRAARIIGDITHQGIMAGIMGSIISSGEPCNAFLDIDLGHVMDFTVNRTDDGSYKIQYNGVFNYNSITMDGRRVWLNPAESKVRYNMEFTLSFDAQNGTPKITFDQPPKLTGKLTPLGIPQSQMDALRLFSDPTDGTTFSKYIQLSGEIGKADIQQAIFHPISNEATVDLLRSRVITKSDTEILSLLNISTKILEEMMSGSAADDATPRLGKEIIGRLLDPKTRDAAIHDLKRMAQPIVDIGWCAKIPDMQPEFLNLVSVAGLSTISFQPDQSDAKLVAEFIRKSADPAIKRLPADLQSSDPATVTAVKARIQEITHSVREGLGLNLLKSHILAISNDQIALLEKHIPPDQMREALQHIVDRDAYFDDAIQSFKSKLEAVAILDTEEQAGKTSQKS